MASLKILRDRNFATGHVGIFVMRTYRNGGVGRRVLEALLKLADDRLALDSTYLTVEVDNSPALHLYERLGFERRTGSVSAPISADMRAPVVRLIRLRWARSP